VAGCSFAKDDVVVSASAVPAPVLVIDDHDSLRAAARALIEATEVFSFAGGAGTGEGALSLASQVRPAWS
jgi:DNA-binding NarL/FixJ family response regulator